MITFLVEKPIPRGWYSRGVVIPDIPGDSILIYRPEVVPCYTVGCDRFPAGRWGDDNSRGDGKSCATPSRGANRVVLGGFLNVAFKTCGFSQTRGRRLRGDSEGCKRDTPQSTVVRHALEMEDAGRIHTCHVTGKIHHYSQDHPTFFSLLEIRYYYSETAEKSKIGIYYGNYLLCSSTSFRKIFSTMTLD